MGNDPLHYCLNFIPIQGLDGPARFINFYENRTPGLFPNPDIRTNNPIFKLGNVKLIDLNTHEEYSGENTLEECHPEDPYKNGYYQGKYKQICQCRGCIEYRATRKLKPGQMLHMNSYENENIGLDIDDERELLKEFEHGINGIQIRDIPPTTNRDWRQPVRDWRQPHSATTTQSPPNTGSKFDKLKLIGIVCETLGNSMNDPDAFIVGEQSTGKTNMSEAMLRLQAKKETIDVDTIGMTTVGLYTGYNIFERENVLTDCEITTIPDNEPLDNQYVKGDPFPEITDTFDVTNNSNYGHNMRIYEDLVRELKQNLSSARDDIRMLQRNLQKYEHEQNLAIGRNDAIVKMGKMLPHLQLLDNVPPEQLTELIRILKTYDFKQLQTNKKAVQLLKEWLTEDEWQELLENKYVTIKSKKHKNRYYRVFENPDEKVQVLQKGFGGAFKKMERLCGLISNYKIPEGDKLVNKIMTIKTNEDYFLEHSNRFDS